MAIYRGSESTGTATQVFNIDGDKGDITVTNGGDTWTIDSGVVNTSKLGGDITAQGKALLDDATAAQQRTTLGLGSAATQDISVFATAAQGAKADTALQPSDIANVLETSDIGTTVQAYSANLDEYAAVNPTTAGLALLDDVDAAAQRTTLGLGTAATTNSTAYATAAQGTKADTAVQPSDIANMLEASDIGVTVQGYDADTAKYDDVTANFTGTLQNSGSNVLVDSDIGSTVLAYDSNLQGFVSTFTLPTIDSTNGYVLTTNGSGTISWQPSGAGSMVYPGAGIAVSTGSAWGTSITDNSTNWNTAYSWGNHATAGYLTSSAIGTTVQAYDADLTTWAGKTAPVGDVVGTTDSQILTNKTISADNNTLSGIAASSFVLSNASGNIDGSAAQKAIPSGDVVGTTDTQTLTNKTLTDPAIIGCILEDVYTETTASSTLTIDPSNGSIQQITLGQSASSVSLTNFVAGKGITVMIADGTDFTITWGTSVTWVGDSAPTLATTGFTVIEFWKVGSIVYGAIVGDVA